MIGAALEQTPGEGPGPRAWVLNLDAEHELEAGRRYAPTRRVTALVARQRRRLIGPLVAPEDVVVTEEGLAAEGTARRARGLVGLAWSPTPRALELLSRAGARVPAAPDFEVLQRVNARPFAARVRASLEHESFAKEVASTLDETLALVARPAPLGWLVRRSFGAAGRGRRRLAAGAPDDAERAWIVAGLRRGPLVVEPWVEVTAEITRSGEVAANGRVLVSPPCFQATTREGAWTSSVAAAPRDLGIADDRAVEAAFFAAGDALAAAGYRGPFGVDAYRHRAHDGRGSIEVVNPMSEINARYTMDWATGRTP